MPKYENHLDPNEIMKFIEEKETKFETEYDISSKYSHNFENQNNKINKDDKDFENENNSQNSFRSNKRFENNKNILNFEIDEDEY